MSKYYFKDFNGHEDKQLADVVRAGALAVYETGGNWDIFNIGDQYYYISKTDQCSSGWFGDRAHFRKWIKRNADRLYRFTASTSATDTMLECLVLSCDGEPDAGICEEIATAHGCIFWATLPYNSNYKRLEA